MRNLYTLALVFYAAVSIGQTSMNVNLIYNWTDGSLPASTAHNNTYNEIWGYEQDGREYAIIGTTMGTHFIDITDEGLEMEVDFVEGAATGPSIVHRDYHNYGQYLYAVCDEGPSTLQIMDLSYLPDSVHLAYDSNEQFLRSHNIFIDTTSAKMYVCGGGWNLEIYSIADPLNPTRLLNAQAQVPFWNQIGYVHDIYVENDIAFCNAGPDGLFMVDFSDVTDVLFLGGLTIYDQQGYNHSGWLMDNGNYYCLADENFGHDLKIIDVSDPSNMVVVDTIDSGVHQFSIPHNPIYHENLLHVAYYNDGYQVWNCDDPEAPVLAGYYDTSTEQHLNGYYRGAWGVYPFLSSERILISDMQNGLFVFDISTITDIEEADDKTLNIRTFPNPTEGVVNMILPQDLDVNSSLQIYDLQGKLVHSEAVLATSGTNLMEIDLSQLPTGLYSAQITSKSKIHRTTISKI